MAIVRNFTTLVSAVVDYFEDDSTELKAYIPTAIDLAEQRLTREIDTTGLIANTNVSAASGNRIVSKPSGYRFGYNLRVSTSTGEFVTLRKTTLSYIEDYWPWANASTGNPKFYADYSPTQFIIGPTPKANYDYPLSYAAKPVGISATSSTNYFTDYMPDGLYYGTLIEMAKFARQNSMLQSLEQSYQNCVQTVINEGRRERRDEGQEPSSPQDNRNSLMKGQN